MTLVDWIALAIVLLAAFAGMQRGLILSAFSLAGLALGAYVGGRIAPHFLYGGTSSLWTPIAWLVGAVVGAGLFQVAGVVAGSYIRGGLRPTPLKYVDSAGGLLFGVLTGLAIVWVCAAVVLDPRAKRTSFRSDVRHSWIVQRIFDAVPPHDVWQVLEAIDPYPSVFGPSPPAELPSTGVLRNPKIRSSLTRVVKVLGTACGHGVEGSGWFAQSDLVVTAAHVVAGERSTVVEIPGDPAEHAATVVVFDVHNDIAVLRITGTTAPPLLLADPQNGAAVVIAGYPLDQSLTAVPGRVGSTTNAFTDDALGQNKVERAITAVGGRVQHGNSGGPIIDTNGAVEGTVFAAKPHSASGYAVPTSIIRSDLAHAGRRSVSTQTCPKG